MPKLRLDSATAAALQCAPGRKKTDYYDEAVTGFVLECRATGGKTFYFRYADAGGRQKQVKLAGFGDAPFAQVRKKAERLRAEVALGGSPAADRAEVRAVPVYASLAAQHVSDAELHHRSASTIEGYIRNHIVPRWGTTRLTDIEPQAVARWLAGLRARGLSEGTVTKVRAIFGRSFELGRRWGVPGADRNPVRSVPTKPLNNARDRSLTAAEAARLRAAAAASRNTQLVHVVDLLLFLGCRLRELLDARWENVDLERRSLFVPTSKNGRSRHVPLSAAALEVIGRLPRFEGCPWLVPNPETLQPFVTIKHAWQAARDAAGLPGLRLHDLRHAAASAMVSAGVDLYAVGKVLGHVNAASTQRYAHLANDTLLAAVEAGTARLQPAT